MYGIVVRALTSLREIFVSLRLGGPQRPFRTCGEGRVLCRCSEVDLIFTGFSVCRLETVPTLLLLLLLLLLALQPQNIYGRNKNYGF